METLLVNAIGTARDAELDGVDYLVVPASMIVPGVLNGSKGPILYTKEENVRSADQWNGMPITLGHPTDKLDNPVSARAPNVINTSGLGVVYNAHVDSDGILKAEAWINKSKANHLNKKILSLLGNGEPIELSTGLGLDAKELDEPLTINGKTCSLQAENYRPDHLAVLLNSKGACSLEDGCGLLVNCDCGGTEKACICHAEFHLTHNEMSHGDLFGALSSDLRSKFSQDEPTAYIVDVFDDFLIFEQAGSLFRLSYSKTSEGSVTLDSGSPQKVRRETSFVIANEEKSMATDALVQQVITNCSCWNAEDKDVLNGFEDSKLQGFIDDAKAKADAEAIGSAAKSALADGVTVGNSKLVYNFESKTWESEQPKKKEDVVDNDDNKPQQLSLENFLEIAPPEVKSLISNTINSNNKQKADLIEKIVANASDDEKEGYQAVLNKLDLDELNAVQDLFSKQAVETKDESNIRSFFGLNSSAKPAAKPSFDPDLLRPLDYADVD